MQCAGARARVSVVSCGGSFTEALSFGPSAHSFNCHDARIGKFPNGKSLRCLFWLVAFLLGKMDLPESAARFARRGQDYIAGTVGHL